MSYNLNFANFCCGLQFEISIQLTRRDIYPLDQIKKKWFNPAHTFRAKKKEKRNLA